MAATQGAAKFDAAVMQDQDHQGADREQAEEPERAIVDAQKQRPLPGSGAAAPHFEHQGSVFLQGGAGLLPGIPHQADLDAQFFRRALEVGDWRAGRFTRRGSQRLPDRGIQRPELHEDRRRRRGPTGQPPQTFDLPSGQLVLRLQLAAGKKTLDIAGDRVRAAGQFVIGCRRGRRQGRQQGKAKRQRQSPGASPRFVAAP